MSSLFISWTPIYLFVFFRLLTIYVVLSNQDGDVLAWAWKWILTGLEMRFLLSPVAQWVVVTHVVNPTHFYVRYAAEKRERDILSKEINAFCKLDTSCFSSADNVQTGVLIFFSSQKSVMDGCST